MTLLRTNVYTFFSLFLVLVIDAMGFALTLPILGPLYLNSHTGMLPADTSLFMREFIFGVTMTAFFVFAFFGSPFMGDLSDQLGRKKVLILCLVGVAAGCLISALGIFFKSITFMILGRAVAGFASGSQSIAQAAIVDISTDENKAVNIGLISLAGCIGFVLGPIIGGSFVGFFTKGELAYSAPFFIAALLAIINAISVRLTVRETYVRKEKKRLNLMTAILGLKQAYDIKPVRIWLLVNLLFQLAWGIYFQFLTIYLIHNYNYTALKIGLFTAFMGLFFSLSLTLIIRVLLSIVKISTIALISLLMAGLGVLGSALFSSQLAQWLTVIPGSIGAALSYATLVTLISNSVDRDSQGMIMGSANSIAALGWVFSGLILGPLAAIGLEIPFFVSALFMFLSFLLIILASARHK